RRRNRCHVSRPESHPRQTCPQHSHRRRFNPQRLHHHCFPSASITTVCAATVLT
ncbi:hypothetical protein Bpfe_008468, partial [Biomphalaria pfeifferi]